MLALLIQLKCRALDRTKVNRQLPNCDRVQPVCDDFSSVVDWGCRYIPYHVQANGAPEPGIALCWVRDENNTTDSYRPS